ncbi:MAG: hypothetical protein WEB57_07985 [Pseudohongiellaceae bacterium]
MRSLATYAMRGRRQAILTAFVTGLIPLVNLLTPALLGLVCLRHGPREALLVTAWAILPLAGWAMAGDVTPFILAAGVLALAVTLRNTGRWNITLVGAVLIGVASEMVLRMRPEFMAGILDQLEGMMAENAGSGEPYGREDMQVLLYSLFGVVHMFLAISLTMLARWWQALLYNPGGFRQEFHGLRLPPRLAMTLAALFLAASFGVPVLAGWVLYFVMPLFFAGLALVHGLVGLKRLSGLWLGAFYLLLLSPVVAQLLTVAALFDSWYDFRNRVEATDE